MASLVSNPRYQEPFGHEFDELRTQIDNWHPKTAVLKEMRRKLEPIKGPGESQSSRATAPCTCSCTFP